MILPLPFYIKKQTHTFMRAFNAVAQSPVGVQNPAQTSQFGYASSWQWDTRSPIGRAFTRRVAGEPVEFWVHVNFDGYRPKFIEFLQSEFGIPSSIITSRWHADHTLNRAFARKHGLSFVRMALLPGTDNMAYGRLMEKSFTSLSANRKTMYLIDYAVMMKLLGIQPPKDRLDYNTRRLDIARRFVAEGFEGSVDLALTGMDGMFQLWKVF